MGVQSGEAEDILKATDIPDLGRLENRGRVVSPETVVDLEVIRQRALLAAKAAVDVKGEDVKVLQMHGLVTYTDFIVLCTGRNTRLTKRIAEEVVHQVKSGTGAMAVGTEGSSGGEWILLDFLDFVVHVFTPAARDFYRLDVLWKQAPVEEVM